MHRISTIHFWARISLMLGLLFAGMAVHAADIYVKGSVVGPGTGTISDPYKSLETAVSAAVSTSTIRVVGGTTYNLSATLTIGVNNVHLLGGYSSDFLTSDSTANQSVIDGGNAVRGIHVNKGDRFWIEGFTIRNCRQTDALPTGFDPGGGGILVDLTFLVGATGGTITHCKLENCVAAAEGGALYVLGDGPALITMTHLEIINCTATTTGGAISFDRDSNTFNLILDDIVIRGCSSSDSYAVIAMSGSQYLIKASNIVIRDCTATGLGLVQINGRYGSYFSHATIAHCTAQGVLLAVNAAGNTATNYSLLIANNIVTGNTITALPSGSNSVFRVDHNHASVPTVMRETVWFNNLYFGNVGADVTMTNRDAVAFDPPTARFNNNLTADPLLVNLAGNDFHLTSGSPAIDAGLATYNLITAPTTGTFNAPTLDLDGNTRPSGTGYDIGAYEYQAALVKALSYDPISLALYFGVREVDTTSTAQNVILTNGASATDNVAISNIILGGTNPGDFRIVSGGSDTVLTPGLSVNVGITFTPSALGARSATLSVTHDDTALVVPLEFALTGNGSSATEIPPAAVDGWWKTMK